MMNLTTWAAKQTKWQFGGNKVEKTGENDYWLPSHFDVDDWNGHWGNNYRINEIQAAVGCYQVDKADMLTDKKRDIGHKISAGISGIKGITPVYVACFYQQQSH